MKRSLDTDGDSVDVLKKARTASESESAVHVYEPCVSLPVHDRINALVEVLLPAKWLTSEGKPVKSKSLWGTDMYTDDSDLVAVLVHTGHVKLKPVAPKCPLLVSLRACPAQSRYTGSERNGIRSRSWSKGHGGASFKVERCLQHTAGAMPPPTLSGLRPDQSRQMPASLNPQSPGPGQSFAVPPSACLILFNLSQEPCYKYSLALIADQSTQSDRWTSCRLRRETLYLEGVSRRYELRCTKSDKAGKASAYDTYSFSQVLKAHAMDRRAMDKAGVPLPEENLKPLHDGIDWEEVVWGELST